MSAMVLTVIFAAPSLAADGSGSATTRRDLTFGRVAAYGGGSLVGAALIGGVAFFGGAMAASAARGELLVGAFIGAGTGYPLGSAVGVTVAGALLKDNGRFLPSFAWAGATMAASAGMYLLGSSFYSGRNNHQPDRLPGAVFQTLGVVTGCLVPAAACVGYIRSRPATGLAARIVPGSLSLSQTYGPDGTSEPAFDLRIAGIRF
jgi:hypothetical protein